MKLTSISSALLISIASTAAIAAGPNAALSGYVTSEEIDTGGSADGTGFGIKGWAKIADTLFVSGEYQQASLEVGPVDIDLDQLRAGIGFIQNTDQNLSLFGRAELVSIELEGADSESGFGVHGGGIFNLTQQASLTASIGYLDIDDESGLEFLVGGEFMISPNFGAFIEYRTFSGDDVDLTDLRGGATFYFGS